MKWITTKLKNDIKKFFDIVSKSQRILITGHTHPDGDVIGSALALFIGISKNFPTKKLIEVYFCQPIPDTFKFLPFADKIKISNKVKQNYDLSIILECSEFSRTGYDIDPHNFKYIINIDHHLNNYLKQNSCNTNNILHIVCPEYASCAEIIFDIFEYLKIKLDENISVCLYTGLVTDTGMFQQINTNQHSFFTAMRLLDYGVEPYKVYKNIYRQKSYNSMLLLSKVLSTMEIIKIKKYKISTIVVTQKMLEETHTKLQDTEDFINFPMAVSGVSIALFFKEERENKIKVSFRSDTIDVEKIARNWSGGGHKFAAGATLYGKLQTVKKEVINYLKHVL